MAEDSLSQGLKKIDKNIMDLSIEDAGGETILEQFDKRKGIKF